MCVLRHSPELFRGCQLRLVMLDPMPSRGCMEDPDELLGYLSLLASARPFSIDILHKTKSSRLQPEVLLREPIMLACRRLILNLYPQQVPKMHPNEWDSSFQTESWLHPCPFPVPYAMDLLAIFRITRDLPIWIRIRYFREHESRISSSSLPSLPFYIPASAGMKEKIFEIENKWIFFCHFKI